MPRFTSTRLSWKAAPWAMSVSRPGDSRFTRPPSSPHQPLVTDTQPRRMPASMRARHGELAPLVEDAHPVAERDAAGRARRPGGSAPRGPGRARPDQLQIPELRVDAVLGVGGHHLQRRGRDRGPRGRPTPAAACGRGSGSTPQRVGRLGDSSSILPDGVGKTPSAKATSSPPGAQHRALGEVVQGQARTAPACRSSQARTSASSGPGSRRPAPRRRNPAAAARARKISVSGFTSPGGSQDPAAAAAGRGASRRR